MRIARVTPLPLLLVALTSGVLTQAPAPSTSGGPTFDVVSIKRDTAGTFAVGNTVNERRDGGSSASSRTTSSKEKPRWTVWRRFFVFRQLVSS